MLGHEPALIATAGYQMAASSPRGTFSQAELTAERVITRCITRCGAGAAVRGGGEPAADADRRRSTPRRHQDGRLLEACS
jgi:hypothetical protein